MSALVLARALVGGAADTATRGPDVWMAELAKGGFTARPEGRPEEIAAPRRTTDTKAARSGRKAVAR